MWERRLPLGCGDDQNFHARQSLPCLHACIGAAKTLDVRHISTSLALLDIPAVSEKQLNQGEVKTLKDLDPLFESLLEFVGLFQKESMRSSEI